MIRRAAALVLFLSLGPPARGFAQSVSLRVGGLHARYADSITGDAGSVGARLGWTGYRTRGIIEGSWAQYTTGDGAGQVWGDISLLGPASPVAAAGLRLSGVANGARGGPLTGLVSAELFGAVQVRTWTLGAGVSAASVRSLYYVAAPVTSVALRARLEVNRRVSVTAAATGTVAGSVRYADATIMADWRRGRSSGGALLGARAGDLRYHPWVQAWASWGLTPAMALEASGGTYPRELTGFDHGAFVNVGLRVTIFSRIPDSDETADVMLARAFQASPATPAFTGDVLIEPADSATTRVTFRVRGASRVAIAGDWNDWTPESLVDDGAGRWTAVIRAGMGAHRFALIADGGRWLVPDGVTKMPDEFGGEVGLLIVR